MRFHIATTSRRSTATPNGSAALIGDWAERVMSLYEDTKAVAVVEHRPSVELEDACLVRDKLQNQLEITHSESPSCAARSLQVLRSADALFRQFTTESTSAADLSAHNHYPLRGEWWWGRLPRARKAVVEREPVYSAGPAYAGRGF
jgi:hypothetical protein